MFNFFERVLNNKVCINYCVCRVFYLGSCLELFCNYVLLCLVFNGLCEMLVLKDCIRK